MKSEHKPLKGRTKWGDDTNFGDFLDELKDAVAGLIEELETAKKNLAWDPVEECWVDRCLKAIKRWLPDVVEED